MVGPFYDSSLRRDYANVRSMATMNPSLVMKPYAII